MQRSLMYAVVALTVGFASATHGFAADAEPLHLFILSGQSNMAGLDPSRSFTPAVTDAFGKEHVIVVKDAMGGQPIRRWYKKWKPAKTDDPKQIGDLYDRLMTKVRAAVGDRKPTTVTFVWMQGERDSKEKRTADYEQALRGLIKQVGDDLKHDDVNFVIGRLSPFGSGKKDRPTWDAIRAVHQKVAEDSPRGAWVDTDDVPRDANDIHYKRPDGFDELGRRFAAKAIELARAAAR